MPNTYMSRHHLETGLIPRNIGQHSSEHGVGRKSKNNNNISNDNQITEIWNTILWVGKPWILTQRGKYTLPMIRICNGDLPDTIAPRNNNDH